MAGYWKQEEETRGVLREGRLRTGDIGVMDKEGYLYITDRLKDLIITSGFNVYPCVVEEAIGGHPSVQEVAVCGIPHQHRGEIVKAYIKLRRGDQLTASELRNYLKDRLALFELPREIEFRSEIPKTLLGKPLRRELVTEELQRQKRQKKLIS